MSAASQDIAWMRRAIALGDRNVGLTGTNPSVGALVVANGVLVGAGVTAPGGREHAESVALAQAGEAARDATLYVTLEPCSYRFNGGMCCQDLTVRAGIARVVVACRDPNPRIAGASLDALRAAGVVVTSGVGEREAARSLAGHLTATRLGRPHVTVKQALSQDGRIAGEGGQAVALTGPAANAQTHLMRARSDAILVGAATVRADDPSLTCRLPGMAARSPRRIVLTRSGAVPLASAVVRTAETVPTSVLMVGEGTAEDDLRGSGLDIIRAETLPAAMAVLAQQGVRRLFVEAGADLAASFAQANLIDAYEVFRTPHTIGESGITPMRGARLASWLAAHHYKLHDRRRLGADLWQRFERA